MARKARTISERIEHLKKQLEAAKRSAAKAQARVVALEAKIADLTSAARAAVAAADQ